MVYTHMTLKDSTSLEAYSHESGLSRTYTYIFICMREHVWLNLSKYFKTRQMKPNRNPQEINITTV